MANDFWTYSGAANWTVAANWSLGLPTSTTIAEVDQGQPQVSSAFAISSLINQSEIDFTAAGASTIANGLNNYGLLALDASPAGGGSSLAVGGAVTNTGVVQLGASDGSLAKAETLTAQSFNDINGELDIYGGSTATAKALVNISSAAGLGATGALTGAVTLSGNAVLEFASGQITSIAGNSSLTLNGKSALVTDAGALTSNSALIGLSSNFGLLALNNGAVLNANAAMFNYGLITTASAAGALTVWSTGTHSLNNYGEIDVDSTGGGGSTVTIGSGLNNYGTFSAGSTAMQRSTTISTHSLSNASWASINLTSGATTAYKTVLSVAAAAGFGATGTLTGSVNLSGYAGISFTSGQIAKITGNLALSGANAFINDANTAAGANSALAGLTSVTGSLALSNGAKIAVTGSLNNSGNITLDYAYYVNNSTAYHGGSSLSIAGALVNGGGLDIGASHLTSAVNVTASTLTNTGSLVVAGNIYTPVGSVLNITSGVAGFGMAGKLSGQVSLTGAAMIEFASGQISTIISGASLSLSGANAFIADAGAVSSSSALAGLTANKGSLALNSGASLTTSGGLTNTGSLYLDYLQAGAMGLTPGGAALTIGGALTNSSSLYIGSSNLTGNDTVTAASLSNSGWIGLYGNLSNGAQALLNVKSAAGFGTAGILTGNVSLTDDSMIEFASGQISTIASGAYLTLDGAQALVADAGALTSNSALKGLTANKGALSLKDGAAISTSGGLTNSNSIYLDSGSYSYGSYGSGGSSLTIGGTLTNSSYLSIGSASLASGDTLTANGLSNTGTIALTGNLSNNALSLLNIKAAAGFGAAGILTGSVSLTDDSMIEFASGQISTLASGASLTLNGPNALITDANALSSNSALSGLALNNGALNLNNGAAIAISGGLTNSGSINLDVATSNSAGGSSLTIGGALVNKGSITIDAATMANGDAITANGLSNSGTITLTGEPSTNAFALLNIKAAAGFGTAGILTGTVSLSNDALIKFASGQISTIASGASLTLSGANAFIADASAPNSNSALAGLGLNAGLLKLSNGQVIATNGSLTNSGTLYLDNYYNSYYYSSNSSSDLGGSSLTIGGVLSNSSNITIGNAALTTGDSVTASGLTNSGTLSLSGNLANNALALLNIKAAAGFGTIGALTGTVSLSNDAMIEFASGQISTIANGASLTLNGANAVVADAAALTSNSALTGLSANKGTVKLANGASVTTSSGLNNSGNIYVDGVYDYATYGYPLGGSTLTIGGVLTNTSSITLGASTYYPITNAVTVTASGLSNTGSLALNGGSSSTAAALLNIKAAAGFGTAGTLTGSVSLANNAMIEFASGQISSIASGASLSLTGANALVADAGALTSNSALQGLSSNKGNLSLYSGASIATSGALTNSGMLYLEGYAGPGGSSLTIGGMLTNSASLYIGNTSLTTSTMVAASGLANSGTLSLTGNLANNALALLNINAAAGFGTAGTLTGTVGLYNDAMIEFASGQISTIASGASLTLSGANALVADAGALTSNSALQGLSLNKGNLTLNAGASITTSGALSNAGALAIDQSSYTGGSNLTVAGSLTNGSSLNLGSSSLTSSDGVTASGLSNSGTISLTGNLSNNALALLNVKAAAGFGTAGTLTGTVGLYNDAMIEFASGQISTIASGASLTLNSANSLVADAGALTSNSALTALSANKGVLKLANGTAVTTTGGLNNSGSISLDGAYDYATYSYPSGGSTLTVGGVLTNTSSITMGYNGYNTSAITVTASGLSNTGSMTLYGGASSAAAATINITAAAGFGTAGTLTGSVSLKNNAMIEFASGQISTVASGASLTLDGANALIADASALTSNSALTGLAANNGSVTLADGASASSSASLTNSGSFYVNSGSAFTTAGDFTNTSYAYIDTDSNNTSGSTLTVGGALSNNSVITTGIYSYYSVNKSSATEISANGGIRNNGSIYNYGGDTKIDNAVSGTGNIYLYDYGSNVPIIEFDSSVGAGQTVHFSGGGELVFGASGAKNFAGAISGWSLNDLLDVKGFGTGTTENYANGVLTLTNGSNIAKFAMSGTDASHFALSSTATESMVSYI